MNYLSILDKASSCERSEKSEISPQSKAGSIGREISEKSEISPSVLQAAKKACRSLSGCITPKRLLACLDDEDLVYVHSIADPVSFLTSMATALVWGDYRRAGIAPPDWTSPATCDRCGPVYLWAPIHVSGCPWCWNRLHQLPIPRPTAPTKPTKAKQSANPQMPANPIGETSAHRRNGNKFSSSSGSVRSPSAEMSLPAQPAAPHTGDQK